MNVVRCQLKPDSIDLIDGVPDSHPTDGQPCYRFDVPDSVPHDNGAWLWIEWPRGTGIAPVAEHGLLNMIKVGGGGFEPDIYRGQKLGGLRPFRLDGHFCRYSDDGSEMLINESTGFRLFGRWRAGQVQADDFARTCCENRLNMVRVSGMQDTSLYLTDPNLQYRIFPEGPQYYQDLADFYDWCGSYGLMLDFVCCMQTQTLMPDPASQVRHVQQVFEVFQSRYAFVSKVNEQGVHDNSVSDDVLRLAKPAGATFLLSTGSKESGDETALEPVGDLVEIHLNDSNEWWRKGHNAWEMANRYNRGGYVSETTRTDKDGALHHFEDDAKTQTAMTLAAMIHTPEGKNADPFDFSLVHLAAHNAGVFDGGVNFRRGQYDRHDCPDLRCYSMTVGGLGTYPWSVRF